ncbi:hypothetical protein LR48_Vigan06g088200 [Vigna angularis]|uniref:Uncharacterized protein n=1 Tax=Phaseolus angularis TaxID=3914 RepID=A0A0L9US87_PHAAN|nr:hypothetical protein LR48_Vigan06g088200 [Vigna angularis]
MEMHFRYISQRLKDEVNTEVNLKEEGQPNVTESDKILDEKKIEGDEEKIERKEKEELSEKDKDEEKEKEVVEREERKKICVKIKKLKRKRKGKKKIKEKKKRKFRERKRKKKKMRGKKKKSYEKSHPHLKKNHRKEKKFKCFVDIFKKLEIKVPMIETLQQGTHEGHVGKARRLRKEGEEHITKVPLSGILPLSGTLAGSSLHTHSYTLFQRGQVATAEMIVGMYDTPPAHRWTMDEFHNVVAWPEEPVHGGGAGAAEASARDMEEDEAEEEDAFDDDEDEEEEEDTEDISD